MPAYYHAQDPAQYYSQRQGRNDQRFSQMLQMMLQMQAHKQKQKQWEEEQTLEQQKFALSEKQLKSLDEHREAQAKWNDYLMDKPTQTPDWVIQAQALISTGKAKDMGTAIMMLKKIKPDKTIEDQVRETTRLTEARERVKAKYKTPPAPRVNPKSKADYNRVKNLLGRYDKEKTRLLAKLPKLGTEDEVTRAETHLKNINKAIYLLTTMGDATADGIPLSEKDQKILKGLLNTRRIQESEDIVLEFKDLPPGTPTASNKSGDQVALINDKWIPILA